MSKKDNPANDPNIGKTLDNGRFKLTQRLGSGSFGEIYKAVESGNEGKDLAVKLEKTTEKSAQLKSEYSLLSELKHIDGYPRVYGFYKLGDTHYAMVMQLLGESLEGLFDKCERRFTVKTAIMIAEQMITRLQCLHDEGYIHRDMKPDNMMIGKEASNQWKVFLIDFGLCKQYRDKRTRVQYDYNERKNMTGTARYASVNNHLGLEQSRRDDIECLFYILLYFLKGILPWQGLKPDPKKERYEKIAEKKLSTPITVLCAGLPIEFQMLLSYAKNLTYYEKPNYAFCRMLLRVLARAVGVCFDWRYDWTYLQGGGQGGRNRG